MSEVKKTRKESEWTDDVREDDAPEQEYEKTYRDGSAVNECWAESKEHL